MEFLSGLTLMMFIMEFYHVITHTVVLCGWRLLPRRDLVKVRMYFLIDTFTVALTAFLVTGKYWLLATLQIVQHLTYFFTWDEASFTRKVISWSSLDWKKSRLQWDLVLGTGFDIAVHAVNVWYLATYHLSLKEVLFSTVVVGVLVRLVLFNPKLSWSNPSNIPAWVQRRVQAETKAD